MYSPATAYNQIKSKNLDKLLSNKGVQIGCLLSMILAVCESLGTLEKNMESTSFPGSLFFLSLSRGREKRDLGNEVVWECG